MVPVLLKKEVKMGICHRNTPAAMSKTSSESMARSVTTVPRAFANDTFSLRFSTAHRANSPTRGITSDRAYDRKTLFTSVLSRGCSSTGSSV